ncbi:MAG: glycosyltransferase family 39 protein [Nanoarchaeota archaeon]|nr:glycosyltransferase family 39 protein [Nanoarchaeota archaeon]MBU1135671.1 glycosyltransferase family 39 protein [Nanoarchaeota archaeon]
MHAIKDLSKNDIKFLVTVCILSSIFYIVMFPGNSFYPDQEQYLTLGNEILNGDYSLGVFHRGPLLPLFISLSFLVGASVNAIIFGLPLILTIALIIVSFVFSKRMIGSGCVSTIILLTLPYFWRWTERLLVETLLTIFVLLSILFFFELTEKKKKSTLLGISTALAMLTKFTGAILIPVYFIYLLFKKKLNLVKTKEFLESISTFLFVFLTVFLVVYILSGSSGLEHLFFVSGVSGTNIFYYIIRFAAIPWSVFFLFGIYKIWKKRTPQNELLLITFFVFFAVFQVLNFKEDRFLFAMFPIYSCIAALGIDWLKEKSKIITKIVFVLFVIFGVVFSAWTLSFDSNHHLARIPASGYVSNLPEDAIIASEVSPYYLSLFHLNVVDFPGSKIERGEIEQNVEEWILNNDVDYVIISIYGEYDRHPVHYYYNPELFGIKLPIQIEYRSNRIPPDTEFQSSIFTQLENSDLFENVYENYQNGQKIFIIYKSLNLNINTKNQVIE